MAMQHGVICCERKYLHALGMVQQHLLQKAHVSSGIDQVM
jgi:hypothetical protein